MPFSPVSRRGEVTADHVRELQRAIGDWQSWTPTVTQGAAITATVTRARYLRVGTQVTLTANLRLTSTGTANNALYVGSIPLAPADLTNSPPGGWVRYNQSGVGAYFGQALWNSTSQVGFQMPGGANDRALGWFGVTGTSPTVTVASGDDLQFTLLYETT